MFSSTQKIIDPQGLTAGQFLMLAALSMEDLSWDYYIRDETHLYAKANMGLFKWGESIEIAYAENKAIISCSQPAWRFINRGKAEENIHTLYEYMQHNLAIYPPGHLQQLWEEKIQARPQTMQATEKIVMSRPVPLVTIAIIAFTVIYFVVFSGFTLSFLQPDVMNIFNWGGSIRLHVLGGEWWRIITACFLHSGIRHLLMNMLVLFIIGRLLEPVLGRWLFIIAYLCTGALGFLLSVMVAGNRISSGASGAIFGMYGVFIALLTTNLLSGEIKRVLLKSIMLFVVYGLFSGMGHRVDNAAHIGGLLSGFIFGYIIYWRYGYTNGVAVSASGMIVITGAVVWSCLYFYHNDTVKYERMLKRMGELETRAVAPHDSMHSKPPERLLRELATISGPAWKSFIAIADSAKDFRFGKQQVYEQQKGLLYRYGVLRLEQNEIWVRSLQTGDSLEAKKDSIRILVYEVSDSLSNLQ